MKRNNNRNYVLVTCLSLVIVVFSMLTLQQQQAFSDEFIPALTINSQGNVGIGIMDSKYDLHVIGDAGFGIVGNVDFVSTFGSYGSDDSQFNSPYDIATHPNGDIYVVDTYNYRVQIFDSAGAYISAFGSKGSGDGAFNVPHGIAIHPDGNIYVVDTRNNRVQIFDSAGAYISQFGSEGSGDGEFSSPYGIAIHPNGDIYVADTYNYRVQIFDSAGAYISQFGSEGSGDGEFSRVYGIAIHPNGDIYVTDTDNYRVQIFDSAGAYISQFGSEGSGDGEFDNAFGIATYPNGDIYVTDADNYRVQIFDSAGAYISQFGSEGSGDGEFGRVYGIAIHPNGDIYVTEYRNNRVQIFSPIPVLLVDNGKVGIGTTTPDRMLDIEDASSPRIIITDTTNAVSVEIGAQDDAGFVGTLTADPLRIMVYNKEKIRIDTDGNVGIGTTSPSQKLDVNGDAIANSWKTHSSQIWKKDIMPLDDALSKITQIQGVTYNWRTDEFPEKSFDDSVQIGLIAEELEMIYPELVYTTTGTGDKSIDYSKLTPILIEAIKEQQDILEQLKSVICPEHPELSACQ